MSDKGFEEVMKQNYLRTVKELVCPGCDERLLRWPVRTCLLGHGVCRLCRDQMKLCPVCNLPLVNEKSKVLDKFLKLLYHEYAKFKIDTRLKAPATKVFAGKPAIALPAPLPGGYRRRNRAPPLGRAPCPGPGIAPSRHPLPIPRQRFPGGPGPLRQSPPPQLNLPYIANTPGFASVLK